MKHLILTITLILGIATHGKAEDSSTDKNIKLNSLLGKVKVVTKLNKCLDVTVESWFFSDPIPNTYQLPVVSKALKPLEECGCKKKPAQANFVLKNKTKGTAYSSEWLVSGPSGTPAKFTLNIPTSESSNLTPPLTLHICCVDQKCP